jgi:hypothetical protein
LSLLMPDVSAMGAKINPPTFTLAANEACNFLAEMLSTGSCQKGGDVSRLVS